MTEHPKETDAEKHARLKREIERDKAREAARDLGSL
jgi:hypothetical protein